MHKPSCRIFSLVASYIAIDEHKKLNKYQALKKADKIGLIVSRREVGVAKLHMLLTTLGCIHFEFNHHGNSSSSYSMFVVLLWVELCSFY